MAQFGRFGGLFVRYGKASRGGPPRRRTVLAVPEMGWISEVLRHWVEEVRPCLGAGISPGPGGSAGAAWRIRLQDGRRRCSRALAGNRPDGRAGPACLRHSYITHLVEFDYPERFVSEQAGHRYAATTASYTGVSDDYRNRLLRRSLERHAGLWEEKT